MMPWWGWFITGIATGGIAFYIWLFWYFNRGGPWM